MVQNYTFPEDSSVSFSYQILYRPVGGSFQSTRTVSRYSNQYTLTRLIIEKTYEVSMRIRFTVSACRYTATQYGKKSDVINFTTTAHALCKLVVLFDICHNPLLSFQLLVVHPLTLTLLY